MEELLINGPINAVRLEGTINNIHKVLYIFMDVHINVSNQTICDNFNSLDFTQYLIKMFKKSTKRIDLFSEISQPDIQAKARPYRGRYIDELNRYMKAKYKNNIIHPNISVHYIDIRDIIKKEVNIILDNIEDASIKFSDNNSQNNLNNMIALYNKLYDELTIIYDYLFNNKKSDNNKLNNILDKIINKYKHAQSKTKLAHILDIVKKYFNHLFNTIDKIKELINNSINFILKSSNKLILQHYDNMKRYSYGHNINSFIEFYYKLLMYNNELEILCAMCFALLVDMFFLRRFVDKNDITNGVIYTGIAHSVNYIYNLVKYFDFDITHISYSSMKDLSEVKTYIKNHKYDHNIEELFFPPNLVQCCNLSKFPLYFE
jgi:hypothetical protein